MKQEGRRQISCWLSSEAMVSLETYCEHTNCSKNDAISKAVENLDTSMFSEHSENTPNSSKGGSSDVHVMQQLISHMQEQLNIKDKQINDLIESQKQNNFIIGGFQKAMGMLEHKDDTKTKETFGNFEGSQKKQVKESKPKKQKDGSGKKSKGKGKKKKK